MGPRNKLSKLISSLHKQLPAVLHQPAQTFAFNSQVKYAGTSGIWIEKLSEDQVVMTLKNRFRVQNHIKGVHACGMALLAESATGAVFGMNISDQSLPLLKSMTIDYVRVAKGDLKGVAHLTEEQKASLSEAKGSLIVPVTVTDSDGHEPIKAIMTWAWIPKKRKE